MIKLSDVFIKNKVLISVISIIVILALGVVFLTKPTEGRTSLNKGQILSEADALNLGREKFDKIKNLYWSWMDNSTEVDSTKSKAKEEYIKEIKDMCTENGFI